ncbi:MAG: flagellar filament capping protein FliD [Hungatella sp.]
MISPISNYNSIYGAQSALNQVKLNQVMKKHNLSAPVSPVPPVTSTDNAFADSISYLKDYSSTMTELMSSANSLRNANSANTTDALAVSSSDTSVVDASKHYGMKEGSFQIEVEQLATKQLNESAALSSGAKATADVSLEIAGSTGTANIAISATNAQGAQKSNSQMMSETAKAINQANVGVKASVITKDGKSSLQIESTKTGTGSQLEVRGASADQLGLSTVTRAAQNASYTVTKDDVTQSYTSESNKVSLDYGRIDMTLKKEGSATLQVAPDPKKTVDAMEKLVNSYNKAVKLLSTNSDLGSGSLRRYQQLTGYVTGSDKTMHQMGLSFAKDGTLALDKEQLTENLKKDPKLTKDVISGSSGFAQRAFSSAQSSLNTSASSLIGNAIKQEEYTQMTDPINFMNSYSRNGAYNMMNYYASGMMFSSMV